MVALNAEQVADRPVGLRARHGRQHRGEHEDEARETESSFTHDGVTSRKKPSELTGFFSGFIRNPCAFRLALPGSIQEARAQLELEEPHEILRVGHYAEGLMRAAVF